MSIKILGISAYYHDSAAAIVIDGKIIAAAQEERFSRKKHDASFPLNAVKYCLIEAEVNIRDINHIIFYDKPFIKFERLLETYLSFAPKGLCSFLVAMPIWLKEKLFLKSILKKALAAIEGIDEKELPLILFNEHHRSHAASAFFLSPFKKAAVLCLDGVGEWATSSVWLGEDNQLIPKWEIQFPHSLGLLYSAFTFYIGFKVNSGEYKLMGLAPYGEPKYTELILNNLIDVKKNGTFRLNMSFFNYATGLTMTNNKFHNLFGGPPRQPETDITQKEMDIACSIQAVVEDVILKLGNTIHNELKTENLCLAGGVALNCVANGRLLREGPFKNIWIQPAAGDAGGAIGSAISVWHEYLGKEREADNIQDHMQGSYLGPSYNNEEIKVYLDSVKAKYKEIDDKKLIPEVAEILEKENVVGWFSGRMEFGPRALGGRSIIGDPRSKKMQSIMNMKIKHRESFRPFAPAVKADKVSDWFEIDRSSPYMLLVAPVKSNKQLTISADKQNLFGIEKLNVPRSKIPAVTHVDYSARIQTIHKDTNPRFYDLIDHFDKRTECPILINTSFNVRGEPIVNTPEDAFRCFMRTEMDYLVLENIILTKHDQPKMDKDESWKNQFELD
jgi:carbamoyltransferase